MAEALVFLPGRIAQAARREAAAVPGSATGGNRAMVEPLASAATAIGIDGLFFETHPDPDSAPSDGPNMLRLDDFASVLERILNIRQTVESFA